MICPYRARTEAWPWRAVLRLFLLWIKLVCFTPRSRKTVRCSGLFVVVVPLFMNSSDLCPPFPTLTCPHSDLLGSILIFHCFCMTKKKILAKCCEELSLQFVVWSSTCWAAGGICGSQQHSVPSLRSGTSIPGLWHAAGASKQRGRAGEDHHLFCQGSGASSTLSAVKCRQGAVSSSQLTFFFFFFPPLLCIFFWKDETFLLWYILQLVSLCADTFLGVAVCSWAKPLVGNMMPH